MAPLQVIESDNFELLALVATAEEIASVTHEAGVPGILGSLPRWPWSAFGRRAADWNLP